jgi:hypothetical protein
MQGKILLIWTATLLLSTQAKVTEEQKENFYSFMAGLPEGRQFLSDYAQRLMSKIDSYLLFNLAPTKYESLGFSIGDWFQC